MLRGLRNIAVESELRHLAQGAGERARDRSAPRRHRRRGARSPDAGHVGARLARHGRGRRRAAQPGAVAEPRRARRRTSPATSPSTSRSSSGAVFRAASTPSTARTRCTWATRRTRSRRAARSRRPRSSIAEADATAYGAKVTTSDGSIGIDAPFPFHFQGTTTRIDLRRLPPAIPVPHVESLLTFDYDVDGRFSEPFITGRAAFAESEFLGATVGAGTVGSIDTLQQPLRYTGEGDIIAHRPAAVRRRARRRLAARSAVRGHAVGTLSRRWRPARAPRR